MALTVAGSALMNWSSGNGRYSRSFRTPTFAPPALSHSTASCGDFGAGAHHDDDAIGLGMPDVLDQAGTSGRRPR